MSELTDLFIQIGQTVGWDFLLFIVFTYEIFYPDRLHPFKGTKLKRLLMEPSPGVIAALEAVYEEHEELSRQRLVEELNGDVPRVWDFQREEFISYEQKE